MRKQLRQSGLWKLKSPLGDIFFKIAAYRKSYGHRTAVMAEIKS